MLLGFGATEHETPHRRLREIMSVAGKRAYA
jgi:hypothetical protein